MKILTITPTYLPTLSGNAIDVERISEGLIEHGIKVKIMTPKDTLNEFEPDIVHIFHAYKSSIGLDIAQKYNVPLIVTITGTDLNQDFFDTEKRKVIEKVLKSADCITFLNKVQKEESIKKFEFIKNKSKVIRRNVPRCSPISKYECKKKNIAFAMVGGIRPVKNSIWPIKCLAKLKCDKTLFYVGDIIDNEYGQKFLEEVKGKDWIKFIGPVDRTHMRSFYDCVDIIINCSESEGGSNVIFEAMCMKKALLVRNIPGNLALVDDSCAMIYEDGTDFIKKAQLLCDDKSLMVKLGKKARERFEQIVNPDEINQYIECYNNLL